MRSSSWTRWGASAVPAGEALDYITVDARLQITLPRLDGRQMLEVQF